jgi:DNA-binding NtrC family response regulator
MADMESKHILIVEDDFILAGLLCRVLDARLNAGHQVESCPGAEEAVARLQHQPFDLLVTDLRMPGASGLDLIGRARQISPQMCVVLMTAYLTPAVEEQARQLAVSYLLKPFEISDFVALVRHTLDRGPAGGNGSG